MKYELKLKPIDTPNYILAIHPDPKGDTISIPVHQLSDDALDQLVAQFAKDLKAKQQKKPATVRSGGFLG